MRELNAYELANYGRYKVYPPDCEEETKLYQLGQGNCEETWEGMTL